MTRVVIKTGKKRFAPLGTIQNLRYKLCGFRHGLYMPLTTVTLIRKVA
jgi:hypothetical protein